MDRLQRSGELKTIARNSRACFGPSPPDAIGLAVEYYSLMLDHYFFTADVNEQQALDSGMVAGNWVRTGTSFRVILHPGCPIANEGGQHPIYRFTGEPNIGPRSHFFTASQDECGYVRDRADWHWMFEGAPFWASEPVAGVCPVGRRLLYRAFNNGKGGDPNHRYATNHAVIDAMVAQGWVDEGAAMCVPAAP
jgi:serine protease